ncbi:YjbH domain-containing protein [Halomonas aquatica]|uniref:YjbH domain-containing protein n=1 Tax=Halomonas aquatica TaxID=3151123 RepID=A0ABV1NE44_9GAMM
MVASKRWYDFDLTLGLGWGYLGNAGDVDSPLGWLDERFDDRPGDAGGGQGGEFALSQLFHGPMAVFGGVEYQTPWEPLVLQLEFEGNDYANEPQDNDQPLDSRANLGARYRLTDTIELRAGWQRGNTAMAGVSFSTNLAGLAQMKRDPPPRPLDAPPEADWPAVASRLQSNAGIRVREIRQQGDDLTVTGEPTTFRNLAKSEARAGRILAANADESVVSFRYRWLSRGLDLREDVHDRAAFTAAAASSERQHDHLYGLYAHANLAEPGGELLYRDEPRRFSWRAGPAIEQNFGDPDGYLYRLSAYASGEYTTDANGWFSGSLTATLADNLDDYDYIADSDLPRVRTYISATTWPRRTWVSATCNTPVPPNSARTGTPWATAACWK